MGKNQFFKENFVVEDEKNCESFCELVVSFLTKALRAEDSLLAFDFSSKSLNIFRRSDGKILLTLDLGDERKLGSLDAVSRVSGRLSPDDRKLSEVLAKELETHYYELLRIFVNRKLELCLSLNRGLKEHGF